VQIGIATFVPPVMHASHVGVAPLSVRITVVRKRNLHDTGATPKFGVPGGVLWADQMLPLAIWAKLAIARLRIIAV
jgi:hypothetical protein